MRLVAERGAIDATYTMATAGSRARRSRRRGARRNGASGDAGASDGRLRHCGWLAAIARHAKGAIPT